MLGGLFVLGVRAWKRSGERRVLALGLLVAALIYVGFAVAFRAGSSALILEASGVGIFGAIAWLGSRISLWWLAAGWLAHVACDMGFHFDRPQAFVPASYPLLCVGFDLVVAGYLLGAASATRSTRAVN